MSRDEAKGVPNIKEIAVQNSNGRYDNEEIKACVVNQFEPGKSVVRLLGANENHFDVQEEAEEKTWEPVE